MELSGKVKKRKIPATETEIDRLSALQDSLVFQILDRLGFKEAVKTALLSKQWRFLWTNFPLAFRDDSENLDEIGSFVAGVRSALAVRRGPALHSLLFAFWYHESFASDVDSWLDFAAKIEVRNLSLHLESDPRKSRYDLPQIIYSNRSLTELSLRTCNAPPPEGAIVWRRLRRLSMVYVRLTQRAINGIPSGCPALEALDLTGCFGFNRLEIGGRRFRRLNVSYCYLREISAPYMRGLEVVCNCITHTIVCSTVTQDVTQVNTQVGNPVR